MSLETFSDEQHKYVKSVHMQNGPKHPAKNANFRQLLLSTIFCLHYWMDADLDTTVHNKRINRDHLAIVLLRDEHCDCALKLSYDDDDDDDDDDNDS